MDYFQIESLAIFLLGLLGLGLATFGFITYYARNKKPAVKITMLLSASLVLYCLVLIYDISTRVIPEILKSFDVSTAQSIFTIALLAGSIFMAIILLSMKISRKYFSKPNHS